MPSRSKFFKVSKTFRNPTPSLVSQRIQEWIEQYNSDAHNNIDLPVKIEVEDDEVDELDWDDVGSCISRCSSTNNSNRHITKNTVDPDADDNAISAPIAKKPISQSDDFLRPKTPSAFHKPKKFKPVIVSSENDPFVNITRNSDHSNTFEHLNENNLNSQIFSDVQELYDINNSFDTQSILNSSLDNASRTFGSITNQLEELTYFCNNLNETQYSRFSTPPLSINQETQTDNDSPINVENTFPRRSYDENSVDLTLAFTDIKKFITLIHEDNQLLSSDSSVEEFLDSQIIASETDLTIKVVANLDYSIDKNEPQYVQMLQKGLNKIFATRNISNSQTSYQRSSSHIRNERVLLRLRQVFAELDENIQAKNKVQLRVQLISWANSKYDNGILINKDRSESRLSTLMSRMKMVLYWLRRIYGLLMQNTYLTKRSIYYQLKSLFPRGKVSEIQIYNALNIVSCFLEVPPWYLNIAPTGKGLVYGDLTLVIGTTHIKCNAENGTIIPTDLNNLRKVYSSAYFILVVEKDTVFQKLLADDLPNKMPRKFILFTGKGYADMITRRLLNILWKLLEIPIFIVVDADPHGIDIFLSYKFGSLNTCFLSRELALPKAKWLGILPSELKKYNAKHIALNEKDIKKLKLILNRPYFEHMQNIEIKREIEILISNRKKCEIEGIFKTNKFFAHTYLPTKLYKGNFI